MKKFKIKNYNVLFACGFLSIFFFTIDLITPSEVAVGILYILVTLMTLWFTKRQYTFLFAIGISAFAILGFLLSTPESDFQHTLINRTITLVVIWVTTILGLQYKKSQETLENLKDKLELERNKLEEVLGIEEGLRTIFSVDKLIDFVVDRTARALEVKKCSLMLIDEDARELCIKGHLGLDEKIVRESRLKIGDPIAGIVAAEGKPVLVKDIETDKRFLKKNKPAYKSKSFISAPIELNEHLIGVISCTEKGAAGEDMFSELDLKILCMIVRQVAVAIESANIYKELKYLTITDPLTSMYNYRHFTKSLDHEINRVQRYSGALCLVLIDLDDFKSYNDTFGHLEGNTLLKEIGRILNENIRKIDIACRYAGDEFVIILPATQPSRAAIVSEKIKKKAAELSLRRKVTLSIGIASWAHDMTRHDLIQKTDTALYQAKKEGKDRLCVLG